MEKEPNRNFNLHVYICVLYLCSKFDGATIRAYTHAYSVWPVVKPAGRPDDIETANFCSDGFKAVRTALKPARRL